MRGARAPCPPSAPRLAQHCHNPHLSPTERSSGGPAAPQLLGDQPAPAHSHAGLPGATQGEAGGHRDRGVQLLGLPPTIASPAPSCVPLQDYLDALIGICYDGVEGLLYLVLFSLLVAASFSTIICATPRAWKHFAGRWVCLHRGAQGLRAWHGSRARGRGIAFGAGVGERWHLVPAGTGTMMTWTRKTPSTHRRVALPPTTRPGGSSAASAATAAAWAARAACTPRRRPSPMPPSPSTCKTPFLQGADPWVSSPNLGDGASPHTGDTG